MTIWITACKRDTAPYTVEGKPWVNAPCNSAEMRSIEIEEHMPVLDPAIVAACFGAGFVPVVSFFLAARVVGEVLNFMRRG